MDKVTEREKSEIIRRKQIKLVGENEKKIREEEKYIYLEGSG